MRIDVPIHDDVWDWWVFDSGTPPVGDDEPAAVVALVAIMLASMRQSETCSCDGCRRGERF